MAARFAYIYFSININPGLMSFVIQCIYLHAENSEDVIFFFFFVVGTIKHVLL